MMKQFFSLTLILVNSFLITTVLYAQDDIHIKRNLKEEREVATFRKIIIQGSGNLHIKYGKKETLKIEGEENIVSQIKSEIRNNELHLGPKEVSFDTNYSVDYYLTFNQLESIEAFGDIHIVSGDSFTVDQFNLNLVGSGKADIKLKVKKFKAQIIGSGFIKAQGSADEQNITIEGAGEFHGKKLSSNTAHIKISGTGEVEVSVNEELDVKIYGAGKAKYYGRPRISQEISGDGEIIPLG